MIKSLLHKFATKKIFVFVKLASSHFQVSFEDFFPSKFLQHEKKKKLKRSCIF